MVRHQRGNSFGEIMPRDLKYLSAEALELNTPVFSKYNFDKEHFINQFTDAQTSNHNEAVDDIVIKIVRNIEAIGLVVMRLRCALAVIRFNNGYSLRDTKA